MIRNKAALKFGAAIIASLALVFAGLTPANATHLRGAVGSLTYNASAKTLTLTSTMVERKDACATYSSGNSLCTYFGFPAISQVSRTTGAVVTAKVNPCSGQSTSATSSVYDNTSQPLYNIFTTTFVIDVSCPSFNTDFDYTFSQLGNNRIGGIKNSTNQTIQFEGKIRIDGTTNAKAPIYNSGYMTNVPYNTSTNAVFSTNLNALEGLAGKSVTYSLITSQATALGGYGGSRIPCSDFNLTTGEFKISAGLCVGSENYVSAFSGGTPAAPIYYVLKTKATDDLGQYTTRDVLLAFASQTDAAPTLTRSASTASVTVTPGTPQTFTYTGSDTDAGQTLTWSTNTLPSWATFTSGGTSGTSPRTSTATLVLNPPAGTNAALTILVSVQDSAAFPLSATNRLDVAVGTSILPPGAPVISAVNSSGTVSFTPSSSGGAATGYSAVATNLSTGATTTVTCTSSSCTFSGLNNTGYSFVVTATNTSGSASSTPWAPTAPVLSISPSSKSVPLNTALTLPVYTITNTGAAASSFTASWSPSAPAGVTFNTTTGTISGTPTASGTYTLTITATGTASSVTFALTVQAAAQTVTLMDLGGAPLMSSTISSGSTTMIDHWVPLRAYSSVPGATISFSKSSNSSSSCKIVTISGITYAGYSTNQTSSSSRSCTYSASAAAFGNYAAATSASKTLTINRSSSISNAATSWTSVSAQSPLPNGAVPSIATFTSPDFATGTSNLSYPVGTVLNSPLRYTLTSNTYAATNCSISPTWPSGIGVTFDVRLCQLVGTVTAPVSSATYTITYKNPAGSATTRTFNFGTTAASQTISFNQPSGMIMGTVQSPRTQSISARATSSLAVALTTTTSSVCTISGASTTAGLTTATVTAVSAGTCTIKANQAGNTSYGAAPEVTQSFEITAALPVPAISMAISGTEDAQRMVFEYSNSIFPLVSTGGTVASYAFLNSAGSAPATVPAGLAFDTATGVLSGAAENSQSRTHYVITATNTSGTSSVDVYLTVTKMNQVITFPALNGMVFADSSGAGQGLGAVADSGMPVSYSIDSADVTKCEIITGGKVRPKAGLTGNAVDCKVWATQAGDTMMFNAATPVYQTFSIAPGLLAPNITLTNNTGYMVVGQPFALPFEVINTGGAVPVAGVTVGVGNQFTVTGSSLPAGLNFSNYYGTYVSGSPTTMGTYTLTITATNSVGSSTAQFVLTVGKQLQTVTVNTVRDLTVGAADATLASTSSSGLTTFTYSIDSSTEAGVCSIVSGKLHALKFGTCILRSDQAGDSTYEAGYGLAKIEIHEAPTLQVSGIGVSASSSINLAVKLGQRVTPGLYSLISTGDPATRFYLKTTANGSEVDISTTSLATNGGIDNFDATTGYVTGTAIVSTGSDSVYICATNTYSPDACVQVTFSYSGAQKPSLTIPSTSSSANSSALVVYIYNAISDPAYTLVNTGSDVYACDGASVYSYSTLTGTLPAGVSFDRCTGMISGTPTALQTTPGTYTFTGINAAGSNGTAASFTLQVLPCVPQISWTSPRSLVYGASLDSVLDPSASCGSQSSVTGNYAYTSTINSTTTSATSSTVLDPGTYTLTTTFTPSGGNSANFATGQTASIQLTVDKCTPTITWGALSSITYGTTLSSTQLGATASCNGTTVNGTFSYSSYGQTITTGDLLGAGPNQLLEVTFTPTDGTYYNSATGRTRLTVLKKAVAIIPVANSKSWGATDPTLAFEAVANSGLLNNQDELSKITATVSRATGETVGTYRMTISDVLSDYYTVSIDTTDVFFTINQRTPVISSSTSLTKPVGATTVTTATANLSPVTWSVENSDDGALFSITSGGLIAFRSAAQAGTYSFTIRATDGSGGYATRAITVTVQAASGNTPDLSLDQRELVLTVGTPIDSSTTYLISNIGSSVDAVDGYTLTSGTMPGGLTFNRTTGQVSGTPTSSQASTAYGFIGTTTTNGTANNSLAVAFNITINKCQTQITWGALSSIQFGTGLSSAQLNAVAKCGTTVVAGTYTYSDTDGEDVVDGAIHRAGVNAFSVVFVPTNTNAYLGSTASNTLNITKKQLTIVLQDAQKRRGSADPTYTWTTTGTVFAGDVDNLPITVFRTDTSEAMGSYLLSGASGSSDSYTFVFDSAPKYLTITNNQPVILGARTATITAPEQTAIDLNADVTVVWTIVGGNSQSMFSINANTGVLTFVAPSSAGTYEVVIRATDSFGGYYEFTVTITVLAGALPSAPSGGGGAAIVKIILKTPKPITTGKPAEKTEVKVTTDGGTTENPTPVPNATILNVVLKDLPTEIQNAKIVEGVVVMQTQAGFTGVIEVPVEVKLETGEVQVTTTKVTVNPEAPTAVVVEEKKATQNVITWAAASGAVEYEVTVNGTSVGTTTDTSFTLNTALAADAKVRVASLGRMDTSSEFVPAQIKKATATYILFKTIDHFAKSSATLTPAMKKILDNAVIAIKKAGYKTLTIEGHADGQAAASSVFSKVSIARATAVKNYLAPKLPKVKMTVRGLGKDLPVATNATPEGQAKNRRATIFATTK